MVVSVNEHCLCLSMTYRSGVLHFNVKAFGLLAEIKCFLPNRNCALVCSLQCVQIETHYKCVSI